MDVKLKRIVIMILLFGVFTIWNGNAVAPADDQEFYGLFGLTFMGLSGVMTLTDYQDRKG
jgi:hypothetical protein